MATEMLVAALQQEAEWNGAKVRTHGRGGRGGRAQPPAAVHMWWPAACC